MGFTGMPAGRSPRLFAPWRQREAELCRVLCQAGIIPSLLGRGSWGRLLEAAAGLPPCLCLQERGQGLGAAGLVTEVRAGFGLPGSPPASRKWRSGSGTPGGTVRSSERASCQLGEEPVQPVPPSVPPSRPACPLPRVPACCLPRCHVSCPQACGLGPPLPPAAAAPARGSLERWLGPGTLRGAA